MARVPEPALAFPVALGDMPRFPQLEMGLTRFLTGAAAQVDVGAAAQVGVGAAEGQSR